MSDIERPPNHLNERSSMLWRQIVPGRAKSPGRLALLQAALEALDRADECRLAIAVDGLVNVTETTGAAHLNPLAKLERESRAQFMKGWSQLHLQWDATIDGGFPNGI